MPAKPSGKASSDGNASSEKASRPCPICSKPSTRDNRPFCSPRCRDVDLNRWLSGSYAIPGRPDEDDDND